MTLKRLAAALWYQSATHRLHSFQAVRQLTISSYPAAYIPQTTASGSNWLWPEHQIREATSRLLQDSIGLFHRLADSLWLAVPKKKVSPSRKGKRSATKFIRYVPVMARCMTCQRVMRQHTVPSHCKRKDCPCFPKNFNPLPTTDVVAPA